MSIVNANPRSTSPPKKYSASTVNSVVPDVMIVRLSVWLTDSLTVVSSDSRRLVRRFSRIRSKMTMVSLTE